MTDPPKPLTCDHCGWRGSACDATRHPREDEFVCPVCWAQGFETRPREERGPLMEAFAPPEPSPRTPKLLVDWTDEEVRIWDRTQRFKAAHEAAPVVLRTDTDNRGQRGFDFMRGEFRVRNAGAYGKSKTRKRG